MLAAEPERRYTARPIAARTRSAAPTVASCSSSCTGSDLVSPRRGLHGGYLLARPAAEITPAQILDALEGPVALTECAAGHAIAASRAPAGSAAPGSA